VVVNHQFSGQLVASRRGAVAPGDGQEDRLANVVSENEQVAVHELLTQLFQPMDDRLTVTLAMHDSGDDDLRAAWCAKLDDLANRTRSDTRFRQAASGLLRNLELWLAEHWLRARLTSPSPLAARFGFEPAAVDLDREVAAFLTNLRDTPLDNHESAALTALDRLGSQPMQALRTYFRRIGRAPEDWYTEYALGRGDPDCHPRQATSIATPGLALPLVAITFGGEPRRSIPGRYFWAYITTDWGGSLAMRWAFYRLLDPRQTRALLRKITYNSARTNDTRLSAARPHWLVRDAHLNPADPSWDEEARLAEAEELYDQGVALQHEGNLDGAAPIYRSAWLLLERSVSRLSLVLQAMVIDSLGNVRRDQSRFREAVQLHEQSLTIARSLGRQGDEDGPGRYLASLGLDYLEWRRPVKARAYLTQALDNLQPGSDPWHSVQERIATLS
jgi:tetratricopeptide (TPR) repeat protein